MRYNASKETWIPMEIKGVEGYFNDMRIDRSTVPSWFHLWELADTVMEYHAVTKQEFW